MTEQDYAELRARYGEPVTSELQEWPAEEGPLWTVAKTTLWTGVGMVATGGALVLVYGLVFGVRWAWRWLGGRWRRTRARAPTWRATEAPKTKTL